MLCFVKRLLARLVDGISRVGRPGKRRLYVAVYDVGFTQSRTNSGIDPATECPIRHMNAPRAQYHWDLMVGPKKERREPVAGLRFRVSFSKTRGWFYTEKTVTDVRTPYKMLVRLLVGKIEDMDRLVTMTRTTPIPQNDPYFRSYDWVATVLERVDADGTVVGDAVLDWETIEMTARRFIETKALQGRFGREALGLPQPMWSMLEDREVLP
ncbi:hypothetical protein DCS_00964 [Drechmeria coniospora]|uniref:Uncharacterized protein n=1 Tax=Drechmeria coniospora TaxID=98403 RepID=A0A151GRW2_DRECN|nr:hypothetical protein DCS_00964 [Drechmeria coniospora]KYK59830.1 hypothetical protein DCS_00964 [Drechmeria coniospora]